MYLFSSWWILAVVSVVRVAEKSDIVIVPVQILGQQTEDECAGD